MGSLSKLFSGNVFFDRNPKLFWRNSFRCKNNARTPSPCMHFWLQMHTPTVRIQIHLMVFNGVANTPVNWGEFMPHLSHQVLNVNHVIPIEPRS